MSVEQHFAVDLDELLCLVAGRAAHFHDVVGFELEFGIAAEHEAVLEGEGEYLGCVFGGFETLRVDDAARNFDACGRCALQQTSGHDYEVFDGGAFGVGVVAGAGHLTVDGQFAVVDDFMHARHHEYVVGQ